MSLPQLTAAERATYEWQMWLPGFGETGQRKLKAASVLISRVGGLGGIVAYQLAAAGVGRLVLAHAGNLKPSDLNRQLLQKHARIGLPRIETLAERLKELNPRLEIVAAGENVTDANARSLVAQADVVVDAAPLFEERFALNAEAFAQGKPMVECAMFALEAQLTTFIPGRTGCLRCLVPEKPPHWKREFPVLGAVSGTIGCLGAVEVVKLLTGLGKPLAGVRLVMDLGAMEFRRLRFAARAGCPVCGEAKKSRRIRARTTS
ncbi:MAG: HesA/MoeB/ThiF family protein [Verrucomicrobia bacterium]|nr:HesA/MoeB/ThiF family protein [Verrucomicrobiota bacterium]